MVHKTLKKFRGNLEKQLAFLAEHLNWNIHKLLETNSGNEQFPLLHRKKHRSSPYFVSLC